MNKRNAYALMFENFSLVFPLPALCVVCSDWLSVSGYTVDMPCASFPLRRLHTLLSLFHLKYNWVYRIFCIVHSYFYLPCSKASDLTSCYTLTFKRCDSSARSQSSNPWHSACKPLGIYSLCNCRGHLSIQISSVTFWFC